MSKRALTADVLRERCEILRASLSHPTTPLASPDEIAAVWPGGTSNPYKGADAWIEAYAALRSFARRKEARAARSNSNRLAAVVRDAAARQPRVVSLSIGDRHVYPKSEASLRFLHHLDATVGAISESSVALEDEDSTRLRLLAAIVHSDLLRTWAWVLLHPEPSLPIDDAEQIEPPEWTAQLTPNDYLTIFGAHVEVHRSSMETMAQAFPPEQGQKSRLGLGGFLSAFAAENGLVPSDVLRRYSVGEIYAAGIASAESHRVATANAKAKS